MGLFLDRGYQKVLSLIWARQRSEWTSLIFILRFSAIGTVFVPLQFSLSPSRTFSTPSKIRWKRNILESKYETFFAVIRTVPEVKVIDFGLEYFNSVIQTELPSQKNNSQLLIQLKSKLMNDENGFYVTNICTLFETREGPRETTWAPLHSLPYSLLIGAP